MFFIFICISSCKKEDDAFIETDSEEPEIAIEGLEENSKVNGDVELVFTASDNKEVNKVDVFLKNELVATLTQPPYKWMFKTREYPDGPYTIKAIAYDKEGNKKEIVVNVSILNIILTVHIGPDVDKSFWEEKPLPRWIFISDMAGKTLGVRKFENEDILEFPAPDDFAGDDIYLSRVMIYKRKLEGLPFETTADILTHKVSAGGRIIINHKPYNNNTPVQIGSSSLEVKNVPNQSIFHRDLLVEGKQGQYLNSEYTENNSIIFNLSHSESLANGLYTLLAEGEEVPSYKLFENMSIGQHYEVDFANFSPMTGLYKHDFQNEGGNWCHLAGRRKKGTPSTNYDLGIQVPPYVNLIYYPEGIFEEYVVAISSSSHNRQSYHYKIFDTPEPIAPFDVQYNFSSKDKDNFSLTTDGNFDMYNVKFSKDLEEADKSIRTSWGMSGKNDQLIEGTLPLLPGEISEEYPFISRDNLELSNLIFIELEKLNSDEYFERLHGGLIFEEMNIDNVRYTILPGNERKALRKQMEQKDFEQIIMEHSW